MKIYKKMQKLIGRYAASPSKDWIDFSKWFEEDDLEFYKIIKECLELNLPIVFQIKTDFVVAELKNEADEKEHYRIENYDKAIRTMDNHKSKEEKR